MMLRDCTEYVWRIDWCWYSTVEDDGQTGPRRETLEGIVISQANLFPGRDWRQLDGHGRRIKAFGEKTKSFEMTDD